MNQLSPYYHMQFLCDYLVHKSFFAANIIYSVLEKFKDNKLLLNHVFKVQTKLFQIYVNMAHTMHPKSLCVLVTLSSSERMYTLLDRLYLKLGKGEAIPSTIPQSN
jgi:hypothetical protein